ncbi:MAG: SsrA-binding protein SmpB [Firmicutes bacterium]|nr:SsrA-binding protein SmpB [Bacillota bacterium]
MAGKTIIENRKARHEYLFLEKYEAGIELFGTEVKSLRAGKASLVDAFARIENGQVWLYNLHISHYEFGNINNHDEKRPRRLLLHKGEIARLHAAVREKGLTLVPVRLYFSAALVKVELALARGKKMYDKRDSMAERDSKRQIERAMKERSREY